ncbi:MAG: precorrin-3B C17-methyltransferase / cobalt-factor methyltransferase [Clostridia bacterium]|nr:precorrin-3B C(17)-methyltransferase [Clostridiales bacterium]MDK2984859.1 precorrin-3B C17-methyltransferase / cobalt-factor methyltransferase [Clostridia bacterium]
MEEADAIVGYKTYVELVKDIIKDKEVVASGMRKEKARAEEAVKLALQGKCVAVISSGDPGVYGMAGITLEVADGKVPVEMVPGVTAATAAAASLGAPLVHDFAVISLSDLLTPWNKIMSRLEASAMADMVIVLYNPRSKGRPDHIKTAREIILWHRDPQTPVGLVRSARRGKEEVTITTLKEMLNYEIDMLTTVIIGNSETMVKNGKMITPRGYDV